LPTGRPLTGHLGLGLALPLLGRPALVLGPLPLPFVGRLPLAGLVGVDFPLPLLGGPAFFFGSLALPLLGLLPLAGLVRVYRALSLLGRAAFGVGPVLLLVGPHAGGQHQGQASGQGEEFQGSSGGLEHG
jgi:hypothetical protein